ncbi:hypothetical protein O6H91_19G029200 [Diphasiastrum complanatum]|uniref:Uncharacterized protein n=2 Tax=Diphasiastrum complanatum TaxID=34168 RepID=A0ACC2ATW2_DIPCM|nr:hypothetical protein O6H91_19G028800 [Diphasiastrum complanatum]KAJ7520910.1 hypothetical protein O6H91_19G029200 [Diphasiastrum complanatum]
MECLLASKVMPHLLVAQTGRQSICCGKLLHSSSAYADAKFHLLAAQPLSGSLQQLRDSKKQVQSGKGLVIVSQALTSAEGNCHRRFVVGISILAGLGGFVAQAFPGCAAVSKKVKLKDVENPKLQDALRAAVAGDLETAEILFSELIDEDGESASEWSNRGSVRLSLGKFDEAEQDLTTAIRLAPNAPVPFLNRAIAYEALGRYQEAISDCKSAILNDPDEYAAWYNLGNVDVHVKDYPAALAAYERASTLAPGIAGYRLKQALVLFQLQKPEEASKLIQSLVRKYPNYAEAHAALAALLWSEDRRSSAEDQFSKALNDEPKFQDIRWVQAELQWPPAIMQAMKNFLNVAM